MQWKFVSRIWIIIHYIRCSYGSPNFEDKLNKRDSTYINYFAIKIYGYNIFVLISFLTSEINKIHLIANYF